MMACYSITLLSVDIRVMQRSAVVLTLLLLCNMHRSIELDADEQNIRHRVCGVCHYMCIVTQSASDLVSLCFQTVSDLVPICFQSASDLVPICLRSGLVARSGPLWCTALPLGS